VGWFTATVPALTLAAVCALWAARRTERGDRRLVLAGLLCAFAAVYAGYLIVSATRVAFDSINGRFINPLYAPAVIAFAAAADFLFSYLSGAGRSVFQAALALTLPLPMMLAASEVRTAYQQGAGSYSTAAWRNHELVEYVRAHKEERCTYYSNAPDALYALTGIHAYWTPKKAGTPMYGFAAFDERVRAGPCSYLVWFGSGSGGGIYGVADLTPAFAVEPLERSAAGAVYRIAPR
jgi:hypothetical protein